jgi:hypothetical protein
MAAFVVGEPTEHPLSSGNYGYSVKVTLTDGGKGTGTTAFTMAKRSQTVSFTSTPPSPVTIGDSYTPTATATSGLAVRLTIDSNSSSVCSINSLGVVDFTGAGTCLIDANQIGDPTYTAATQAQQSITVNAATTKLDQTISFTSTIPTLVTAGDPTYTPAATATSGLTVAISLDITSSGCSLTNGVVTFTNAGVCVIDANQIGDTTYNAAPQAQQSITVNTTAGGGAR